MNWTLESSMLTYSQTNLTGKVQGTLLRPDRPNEWGILVLGGSSGRVDVERASLFASLGARSLALQWFGGDGQAPGILENAVVTQSANEFSPAGIPRSTLA